MPVFPIPPSSPPVRPLPPKQSPLVSLVARRGSPGGTPGGPLFATMRPHTLLARLRALAAAEQGMTTAEYAIGTLAAAAFAAVLYAVVSGDSVVSALTDLVERALSVDF